MKFLSKLRKDAGISVLLALPLLAAVGLIAAGLVSDLLAEGGNQLFNLDANLRTWWTTATP